MTLGGKFGLPSLVVTEKVGGAVGVTVDVGIMDGISVSSGPADDPPLYVCVECMVGVGLGSISQPDPSWVVGFILLDILGGLSEVVLTIVSVAVMVDVGMTVGFVLSLIFFIKSSLFLKT